MAVNLLTSLNSNSDIDPASLARQLADAEKAPREERINAKIASSELAISAYGMVKSALLTFQTSLSVLDDQSALRTKAATSSDSSVVPFVTGNPTTGSYTFEIDSLATSTRLVSESVASQAAMLNGGASFDIDVTVEGITQTLTITDDSIRGIAEAINAAGLNVEATVVQTAADGSAFSLLVSGTGTGSDAAVSVSMDASILSFTETQSAADAEIVFNGVTVYRDDNVVTDLIDGVTLALDSVSSGEFVVSVDDDTSLVSDAVSGFVASFNELMDLFDALDGEPDTADDLLGALNADANFRRIRSKIENEVMSVSDTASTDLSYLSDIGIRMTRDGRLELDDDVLSNALIDDSDSVITMLTGWDADGVEQGEGAAGAYEDMLVEMLDLEGAIETRIVLNETQARELDLDLAELEERIERIYERYLMQFTIMNTLVSQLNATKDSLITQLENLPFTRKNN